MKIVALVSLVVLVGTPAIVRAQGAVETHDERTFGTKDSIAHILPAWAFTGNSATDIARMTTIDGDSRSCGLPCLLTAGVVLPAGARVTAFEVEGCDPNPSRQFIGRFYRSGPLGAAATLLAEGASGVAAAVGCFRLFVNLPVPETVNNHLYRYRVDVGLEANLDPLDQYLKLQAVRVYYTLQVSPAPGAATFNDVPANHPFFQWIEALAAAGVTTGCNVSPPLYCPNDFVTRGQMAVFISRALGLHWWP
jgi:hypothetical protein